MKFDTAKYIAQNYTGTPTINRFQQSNAFVRGLMGPYGSGKSTGCIMEMIHQCLLMPRFPGTSERRSEWCIIRKSYPRILSSLVKSFYQIFPTDMLTKDFNNRKLPRLLMNFDHPDGETKCIIAFSLMAIDTPKQIDKLASTEFHGIWLNEVREIPEEVLQTCTGRVNRQELFEWDIVYKDLLDVYNKPKLDKRGNPMRSRLIVDRVDECGNKIPISYWSGIIMDTNPPDRDHWYTKLEASQPEGYDFFQQPPALLRNNNPKAKTLREKWIPNTGQLDGTPAAENVDNVKGGFNYYYQQAAGKTDAWIRVYIQGKYGTLSTGRPVYPMYNDALHFKHGCEPFMFYPHLPVFIGIDIGYHAAAVFCQVSQTGQFRVLDELYSEHLSTREFIKMLLLPYVTNKFKGMKLYWYIDPAGRQRMQTDGQTNIDEYHSFGIPVQPATTNNPHARQQAVTSLLVRHNGFIMSSLCHMLRAGFDGEYCLERIMTNKQTFKDQPNKRSKYSHIHDALQYVAVSLDPLYKRKEIKPITIKKAPKWGCR